MAAAAMVLALVGVTVDGPMTEWLAQNRGWTFNGRPEGASVDAAFNQIRQYGRSSTAVTVRLLDTIAVIAGCVHRPEDRATLMRHADMMVRGAREGLPEGDDRRVVEERWQTVRERCNEPTGAPST